MKLVKCLVVVAALLSVAMLSIVIFNRYQIEDRTIKYVGVEVFDTVLSQLQDSYFESIPVPFNASRISVLHVKGSWQTGNTLAIRMEMDLDALNCVPKQGWDSETVHIERAFTNPAHEQYFPIWLRDACQGPNGQVFWKRFGDPESDGTFVYVANKYSGTLIVFATSIGPIDMPECVVDLLAMASYQSVNFDQFGGDDWVSIAEISIVPCRSDP